MRINTTSPREVAQAWRPGMAAKLIDVRGPAEYRAAHIEGSLHTPLDSLDPKAFADGGGNQNVDRAIYFICRTGNRSAKACERFQAAGFTNVHNVGGGMEAWERARLPVTRGAATISLERQVRIGAGSLVLAGLFLGRRVRPAFYAIAAFAGAGLLFAGVTDYCGMAKLLEKMPWNRDQ